MSEESKPIKIIWTAPNGKNYMDTIPMTLIQYQEFVDNLLKLKRENVIKRYETG